MKVKIRPTSVLGRKLRQNGFRICSLLTIFLLLFLVAKYRVPLVTDKPAFSENQSAKIEVSALRVILLVTPSPETQLISLVEAVMQESGIIGIRDVDSKLIQCEKHLMLKQEQFGTKTWKDPPPWIGYGFTDDNLNDATVSDFRSCVAATFNENSGSSTVLLHSSHLQLTLPYWLKAFHELAISNATVVFGRRSSVQEQVYSALDQMEFQRLSAPEYRSILLKVYLPRLESIHREKGMVIFESLAGKWSKTSTLVYPPDEPETQSDISLIYQEAVITDDQIQQISPEKDSILWPKLVRRDDEVYVSIVTASKSLVKYTEDGDKEVVGGIGGSDGREAEYTNGIIGLGRSISFFDASRERLLLVTDSPLQDRDGLSSAARRGGWNIHWIQPIADRWFSQCKYRPTRSHQNVRWGLMMSKLRILELEKRAVLYMDLDIVVTGRLRRLFGLAPPEYRMISEGGLQHEYLNAGFLFVRPDTATLKRMLDFYENNPPKEVFHNLIDCTEMGLINSFFGKPDTLGEVEDKLVLKSQSPDVQTQGRTARLPLNTPNLSVGRPDVKRWNKLPLAYHFIRKDLCPKPWSVNCTDVMMSKEAVCLLRPPRICTGITNLNHKCDMKAYTSWCRFMGHEQLE